MILQIRWNWLCGWLNSCSVQCIPQYKNKLICYEEIIQKRKKLARLKNEKNIFTKSKEIKKAQFFFKFHTLGLYLLQHKFYCLQAYFKLNFQIDLHLFPCGDVDYERL